MVVPCSVNTATYAYWVARQARYRRRGGGEYGVGEVEGQGDIVTPWQTPVAGPSLATVR